MTTESGTPKRRGRPPAPEEKKRRHNLTFRIRGDLKEEIERKAALNGRSVSEEMEFIIEKSLPLFDEDANSFISDIRPLLGIHIKDKFNSASPELYQASISQRPLIGKDNSGINTEDVRALYEASDVHRSPDAIARPEPSSREDRNPEKPAPGTPGNWRYPLNINTFMNKIQSKYDDLCSAIEKKADALEEENKILQEKLDRLKAERSKLGDE